MSRGTNILRVQMTHKLDLVDGATPALLAAKLYPWSARIIGDVPLHVEISLSPTASESSTYVNEFDDSMIFAVGAGEGVSILGEDVGSVWISEVRQSS